MRRYLESMIGKTAIERINSGGQTQSGLEGMITGCKEYFRMFSDYTIGADTILADGPLAAAFGWASGTYNGKRSLERHRRKQQSQIPASIRRLDGRYPDHP